MLTHQPVQIDWVKINTRVETSLKKSRLQNVLQQNHSKTTHQGFWVSRHEVTFGQYQKCVDEQICSPIVFDGCRNLGAFRKSNIKQNFDLKNYQDMPVVCITWHQANHFAKWVGARLPTKLQWNTIMKMEHPKWEPLDPKEAPDQSKQFSFLYSSHCITHKYQPYLSKGCKDTEYQKFCRLNYHDLTKVCSQAHQAPKRRVCDLIGSVDEWLYDLYYPLKQGAEQCDRLTQPTISPKSISCQRLIAITLYRGDDLYNLDHDLRGDASPYRRSYAVGFRVVKDQD